MCGIVGAIAQENVLPTLLESLRRLEYRGYDSCGIALLSEQRLQRIRSTQRVADLQAKTADLSAKIGIAHTRWATHGAPVTQNAHPHFSKNRVALVHNGIIENHTPLRAELEAAGYVFESETDTEVIVHLIDQAISASDADLLSCVWQVCQRLKGAFAIVVLAQQFPGRLVAARRGSPLVVSCKTGQQLVASDALAIAGLTNTVIYLEEGDVADLDITGITLMDAQGQRLSITQRPEKAVPAYSTTVDLGSYQHYMQKEIFEQPWALSQTLHGIYTPTPEIFGQTAEKIFTRCQSILILACGTSYYAGLTAKYWIEALVKIPVQVEIASEYRYRDTVAHPHTLVIAISQSGETADTLAALTHAQSQDMQHTLAICNVADSSIVRASALSYITRAGMEIGVASTKAFTAQLAALFLLTLTLARCKKRLDEQTAAFHIDALRRLPLQVQQVLALEKEIIPWAHIFARKEHALFLGRGLHYPIALEGALKMKEITYIHAEAYAAGELKHGPLALICAEMPVVTVAPNDALIEKLKSNMEEVRSRGGQLYVFADAACQMHAGLGVHLIRLPAHDGWLSPILQVIPLQLLAYHTALARGTDVDKPRNLAKSVTVE